MESKVSAIEVGRRVYCGLYGGKFGVIYAVHGEPGRVPVSIIGGVMHSGGSSEVDVAWDGGAFSKKVPECILLGVQWKVLEEVVDAEAVAASVAASVAWAANEKAKDDAKKAAFEVAKAVALEAGKKLGLIPEAEFRAAGKRGSAAAHNLRVELKKAGIKVISLRSDGYRSINVRVAEADHEKASSIGCKYKAGNFDGMSDCYEYDPSAWGAVFGDVNYVFIYRGEGCL